MKTENQIVGSFNELVFENRNKAYGAYVLRNQYTNNMSVSLFSSIAFFCIVALIAFGITRNTVPPINKRNLKVNKDSTFSTLVVLPHEEPIEKKVEKKVELVKPHSDNNHFVVTNNKVEETPKPTETLVITKTGTPEGKDSSVTNTNVDLEGKPNVEKTNETKLIVTEMPEFKGDLFRYLSSNLRYPQVAVENQTEGQVFLTFVVEKDGSIGDVKVLKPLKDGCTEEAIRVVSAMPKWKPGKNYGELVRVQYNLPIRFRLK